MKACLQQTDIDAAHFAPGDKIQRRRVRRFRQVRVIRCDVVFDGFLGSGTSAAGYLASTTPTVASSATSTVQESLERSASRGSAYKISARRQIGDAEFAQVVGCSSLRLGHLLAAARVGVAPHLDIHGLDGIAVLIEHVPRDDALGRHLQLDAAGVLLGNNFDGDGLPAGRTECFANVAGSFPDQRIGALIDRWKQKTSVVRAGGPETSATLPVGTQGQCYFSKHLARGAEHVSRDGTGCQGYGRRATLSGLACLARLSLTLVGASVPVLAARALTGGWRQGQPVRPSRLASRSLPAKTASAAALPPQNRKRGEQRPADQEGFESPH